MIIICGGYKLHVWKDVYMNQSNEQCLHFLTKILSLFSVYTVYSVYLRFWK